MLDDAERTYQREYQRRRYRRRLDEAISLLGGKCVDCGSTESLQLDHVDPTTKLFTLADFTGAPKAQWDAEVAKCQVLCRPCHDKKTIRESYPEREHGTWAMYRRGKCRCNICRTFAREYMRRYRAAR